MATFKGLKIEARIEAQILAFLNRAKTVKDITESSQIKDDPTSGTGGNTIGETVAQRIIDLKNSDRFFRFHNIEELEQIDGLGVDKMKDLVHSFSETAAEAFRRRLFNDILGENWELKEDTVNFETEEEFINIIKSLSNFKAWVTERRFGKRAFGAPPPEAVLLLKSFVEVYDIADFGGIAFGAYFYHISHDNWFSFETIRQECEIYLGFYPNGYNIKHAHLELRLLKGYLDEGIHATSTTQGTLPVVINYPERAITIWEAFLYD